MNIVRKNETLLKTSIIAIYAIYIAAWTINPNQVWPDTLFNDSLRKKEIIQKKHVDILIIGGSNAVTGISAKQIEEELSDHRHVLNLSISGAEGAGKLNYTDWLATRVKSADTIIYSSMNFWYLSGDSAFESIPDENYNTKTRTASFPPPMTSTIKHNFLKEFNFDRWGDLTHIECEQELNPFPVENMQQDLLTERVKRLAEKIKAISQLLSSEKIFLRIPPIYISPNHEQVVTHYIATTKALLAEMGVIVMPSSMSYTTDPKAMCFGAVHPTLNARRLFTQDLAAWIDRSTPQESHISLTNRL